MEIQIKPWSSASQHRWMSAGIVLLAALSTLFAAGLMFKRATTPWARLPDNDYWWNIAGVITEHGVRLALSPLLSHNNEHIVLIPKLIYAANYWATSGSNIGLIVYSIVIGTLCSVLLILRARAALKEEPMRLAICALLFPLIMLSTKLTHSYFLGMSGTIWLTADLFVILSLAALARAVVTKASLWLLLSLASAILGVFTYSTAIYALVVLLVVSTVVLFSPTLRNGWSKLALVVAVMIALLVVATLFAYRNHPPGHPPLVFNPLQLASFVLIYIGNALPLPVALHPIGGLVLLSAGAVSIWHLVKQRGDRGDDVLFWTCLFLFAPFNALMTGIGRLGYGMAKAEISRYQSVAALTLIATISVVLMVLPKGEVARSIALGRSAIIVAILLSVPLVALNPAHLSGYAARNERKAIAEIALRLGLEGDQDLRASTQAPDQLKTLLPALRAARHVPFVATSRCEQMAGRRVVASARSSNGSLETISRYELSDGRASAVELSGWAERRDAGPDCVVVVDQDQRVIGAGVPVRRRKDIEQDMGRSLGLVGWEAVASLPQGKLCVMAAFPNDDRLTSIGDCKHLPR